MSVNNDSYNEGGYYAFFFSMVLSIGLIIVLSFMYKGIDVDDVQMPDKGAEQTMAGAGKAEAAFDPSSVAEPWVFSEEFAAYGKKTYSANCQACHGAKADGNGPAGGALNPPPRNLIKGGWTKGGTSIALYKTLKDGIAGTSMASFGHLSSVDRWAMVHYIRSITEDKPADDAGKLAAFGKTAK